mmetsp:Transcript_7385/g.11652  ORF Transcript_7385/g.11652 Transcript_7385/m.11652 type:complete len:131 (+) Transcript_7385:1336-1728(+)
MEECKTNDRVVELIDLTQNDDDGAEQCMRSELHSLLPSGSRNIVRRSPAALESKLHLRRHRSQGSLIHFNEGNRQQHLRFPPCPLPPSSSSSITRLIGRWQVTYNNRFRVVYHIKRNWTLTLPKYPPTSE